MKPYVLPVAIAITISATTGISLAFAHYSKADGQTPPSVPTITASPTTSPDDREPTSPSSPTKETPRPDSNPSQVEDSSDRPDRPDRPSPRPTPPEVKPSTPAEPPLDNFPHQRIRLVDEAAPGTEFYRFRSQFRRAIAERDADFITALISDEGVTIGYGRPQTIAELDLDNPNAYFWAMLEKAMSLSCETMPSSGYPDVDPGALVWNCPNVAKSFYEQYPYSPDQSGVEYELSKVIVIGNGINVRLQPNANSRVVGVLTDEIVELDQDRWQQQLETTPEEEWSTLTHPLDGWTPVILPNDERGYISNRYIHNTLAPQVILGQVNGSWQILHIPAGD